MRRRRNEAQGATHAFRAAAGGQPYMGELPAAHGFHAVPRIGTYVAIPSRPPAEILVPVDHPLRACRRSPLTGAEEKATYHIRNIFEWRFIRVFNALPE